MSELPFDFEIPFEVFEKADEEPGKQRRIGGLASVETKDKQEEILIQDGLDFSEFETNGWFNDNHSRETTGILGYPDGKAKYVKKGEILPTGKTAPAAGHWVEGYLLGTKKADEIWELGNALQKTNRRLGFSVEGKIKRRSDKNSKVVVKAKVRNVAITGCPVNTDATMDVLTKSLIAVGNADPGEVEKALGMGHPSVDAPVGPQTGEGAGQVITRESLESDEKETVGKKRKKKKKKETKKSLTNEEARAWVKARLPRATDNQVDRVLELTRAMKRSGKI